MTVSPLEMIYRAVVASALDCIVVIDEDGQVIDFNPAAEKVFQYARAEALGRPISDLIIPPEWRERHTQGLRRYLETGQATVLGRRVELDAMRKDGSRLPVELAITEVPTGERRLFTAHLRDLTEARRAQEDVERHREALHQSEKLAALGSLLAGIAHEMNNPLSIVIGQAMMLRETTEASMAGGASPEIAERAQKIEHAANRCARIVKTFLAMARQRQTERSAVDIGKTVESVLELLAYGLRTAGIDVVRQIPTGLPALWADADQLHQVIANLLINARQALEEKPGGRRIVVAARQDEGSLVVRVADNGPGVPEPIRRRIFDPFFTTKPQGMGTGVGLAVSRGLIEAHGGRLELASAGPNEGAVFEIRLPLSGDDGASDKAGDKAGAPVADSPPQALAPAKRALVIDDEEEISALLAGILNRLGFSCDRAVSGTAGQALLAAPGADYDLILCDLRMPEGDGSELFDWMSEACPGMTRRIAFVTGDTLGPAAGRFLARSGCPVIEKPFHPEDIRAVVEQIAAGG